MPGVIAEKHGAVPLTNILAHGVGSSEFDRVLKTIRKHLGMDVAFISHFREKERVLDSVDADDSAPFGAGDIIPLEEGYCRKVVLGELPQLIPDTSVLPEALALPATSAIPIGAHLSVPIVLDDGDIYGTLCCFSYEPDQSLGERDLKIMQAFAEVLASRIAEMEATAQRREEKAKAIRHVIELGAPRMVFQPIYLLDSGQVTIVESLARFDAEPYGTPDLWFAKAHEAGLGHELEMIAVRKALGALDVLPSTVSVAVNGSPDLVTMKEFHSALENVDLSRVMLEITEHATVVDYEALASAIQPLRKRGLRLAIDDVGAGYASMRHILRLHPDSIKLDMSLTRDIDCDPSRRALAKAMISFARDIGSRITAEGVETASELEMLRSLGVHKVQGYYLSKPVSLEEVLRLEQRPKLISPFTISSSTLVRSAREATANDGAVHYS